MCCIFFFKQNTAYELRISYWSSDVCSSDLPHRPFVLSLSKHCSSFSIQFEREGGPSTSSEPAPDLIRGRTERSMGTVNLTGRGFPFPWPGSSRRYRRSCCR